MFKNWKVGKNVLNRSQMESRNGQKSWHMACKRVIFHEKWRLHPRNFAVIVSLSPIGHLEGVKMSHAMFCAFNHRGVGFVFTLFLALLNSKIHGYKLYSSFKSALPGSYHFYGLLTKIILKIGVHNVLKYENNYFKKKSGRQCFWHFWISRAKTQSAKIV